MLTILKMLTLLIREGIKKRKRTFYSQTGRKGGGEGLSATSALTVSKRDNFDPFLSIEYDSMILKTHSSHCEGSQEGIFNYFNTSAIPLSDRFVTEQRQ